MHQGKMGNQKNLTNGKTNLKKLKIAVLGSYTLQNIKEPLKNFLLKKGFDPEIKFGGYGQYNQDLRDDSSWMHSFVPDIIVIAISSKTFFEDVEYKLLEKGYGETLKEAEEKTNFLLDSIKGYGLPAKIILTTPDRLLNSPLGPRDILEEGISSLLEHCNKIIRNYSKGDSRIILFDSDRFFFGIGKENLTEEKMYYLGKIFLSKFAAEKFAEEISHYINSIYGRVKKCLIVDLDNTIWGGIVGEEGAEGIVLGESPVGEIYSEIQKILLNYQRLGFLLAISSKNNEEDVWEAFQKNKRMILKKEDFVAHKINWNPKSENIVEIAKELNLGTESFIFLDDNPVERLEVSKALPEIEVVDFPKDISNLPNMLKELPSLKRTTITDEDKKKHNMYLGEKKRLILKENKSNKDYLKELQIKINVKKDDISSLTRISQLINKTNQFNLRTQRYSEEEVKQMINSKNYKVFSVRVWDKFGELGLTGVIILKKVEEGEYFIDSFLMSCRILSRGIEKQFFIEALKLAGREVKKITAEYIPSKKNSQVENFLESLGFVLKEVYDGKKKYFSTCSNFKLKDIPWIKVENE